MLLNPNPAPVAKRLVPPAPRKIREAPPVPWRTEPLFVNTRESTTNPTMLFVASVFAGNLRITGAASLLVGAPPLQLAALFQNLLPPAPVQEWVPAIAGKAGPSATTRQKVNSFTGSFIKFKI